MSFRRCRCPAAPRRCCLRLLLTEQERQLLNSSQPLFDLLNIDTECHASVCPCLFEERLRKTEVAVIHNVVRHRMWEATGDAIGTAIWSTLFGGAGGAPESSKLQGYELTKYMIEEIKKAQGDGGGDGLTRYELNQAVLAATAAYTTGALDIFVQLVREEQRAVELTVRSGAPEGHAPMER